MFTYELEAYKRGMKAVAGTDEAGRGPLAGPVVAAAVVFDGRPPDIGINDSKKLTPKKRERLAREIYAIAASVGVGLSWPCEIDDQNILRAALIAMKKAVDSLAVCPELVLVDGSHRFPSDVAQQTIVSGDSLSVSIAAASIIAKTARDSIMLAYHAIYPRYNFIGNKGYPTKDHLEAIQRHGPCPIHRRSFRGVSSGGAHGV